MTRYIDSVRLRPSFMLAPLLSGGLLAGGLASGCQCGGAPLADLSPPPLVAMGITSAAPRPASADAAAIAELHRVIASLEPLHRDKRRPGPDDWLATHNEGGQTFDAYRKDEPVVVDLTAGPGKRNTLYIQPLGELTESQTQVVKLTASYMHRFFGVPVKLSRRLPLSLIPASARRTQPSSGGRQILTSHVLDEVLLPRLPDDAAAYISFTASDLWPGKGWNFVFGQASLTERVGIWSVHRYGDPDQSEAAYRLMLLRTLKVAVHETGHMFSIKHCTAHECVMGGSNNLTETDRAPLWLCPECMAKMCWATKTDPADRYRRLADFSRKRGFTAEAAFFENSLRTLSSASARAPKRP